MKTIDGSQGEGGGQILRSALALSMCLQEPVQLHSIRAGRKKTGLLRQHLTCVRAAAQICNARISGNTIGSDSIEFYPEKIKSGDYHFAIGTAGSTTLVCQTILPALLQANKPSTIVFEGGTHNQQAPSFDFFAQSFLPQMRSMGYKLNSVLDKYGFYPNGGGQWQLEILPHSEIKTLQLTQRGEIHAKQAVALSARIPKHVGERELKRVQKKCGWNNDELKQQFVQSCGPGNILSLRLSSTHSTELLESVGQSGISAERVAGTAISQMQRYLNSNAVVGEYLCDQLLLPLALGKGGSFTTIKPSLHTLTNINIIQSFIGCLIDVNKVNEDKYKITVSR